MRYRFTLSVAAEDITTSFPSLGEFSNFSSGDASWSLGANPSVTLPGAINVSSTHLRGSIENPCASSNYDIDYDVDFSGHDGVHAAVLRVRLYDSTYTTYEEQTATFFSNGNKTGTLNFTPAFTVTYVVFIFDKPNIGLDPYTLDINSYIITGDICTQADSELVISEPDGWKDATLKLERHERYHSLVEHFEGDFTFYGENEFVNGGLNFIKQKVSELGVDVTINILIEIALNDVDYETVFTGQLAIPELKELINNKLKCNIIREDFWSKFIKRYDTPVDLQSPMSIDGEDVTVYDSVNVNMLPQKIIQTFYGYFNEGYVTFDTASNDFLNTYVAYDVILVEIDEIEEKYSLPILQNSEKPVWIFEPKYQGEYTFDIRWEASHYSLVAGSAQDMFSSGDADYRMKAYIQKNDDTPIEFSKDDHSYNDGIATFASTSYLYQGTMDLVVGDIIRIYAFIDIAFDSVRVLLTWGRNSTNIVPLVGPPASAIAPSLHSDPSYIRVTANTLYPATNAEGFLLHDAAGLILDRIISGDEIFYSDYLGGLQTLYRIYETDGCAWQYILLKGLQIRQYSLIEKPFFLSFKQWWEGANPILNLGLGYETIDQPPGDEPTVDSFGNEQQLGTGDNWSTLLGPLRHSCTPGAFQTSKLLAFEIFGGIADADYNIGYDLTLSDAGSFTIHLYDSTLSESVSDSIFFGAGGGNQTGTSILTPTFIPKYLTFRTSVGDGALVFDVLAFTFSVTNITDPAPFDVIRIEEKAHFYDNSYTSLYIGNIRQIEWSFDPDHHFNLVRIGYNKWESEAASGLDDPQTKRIFNTRFKKAGQAIDLYSSFIAAGLTFEQTRRTTKEKSADYKYDNDTFILAINPDPVEISPETSPDVTDYQPEFDENFDFITGINNPESRYNLRLTPIRNLIRWLNYLSGCLQKYLSSSFSFASGEGNYDMISELTQVSPDCGDSFDTISENGSIGVSSDYLFIPKLVEITIPMTWEQYLTIRQYRKNPIGISQSTSNYVNLFIKELSFKPAIGQAEIKGWPDQDFEITVPEDTFIGNVCVTYPVTDECSMLTEDSQTMLTEDNEVIILEECTTSESILLETGDDILLETGELILKE